MNQTMKWAVAASAMILVPLLWWLSTSSTFHMGNRASWSQATYVWNSQVLLDENLRPATLADLSEAGIDRIYLGLNRRESTAAASGELDIEALIAAAGARGIGVDLLLGEPLWMKPEHRHDLLALITSLAHIPFERLHLDLEVDQLEAPVTDEYLQDWLHTLAAAVAVSPWPVTIDSHHRWFHAEDRSPCVPCALPDIGIDEVSIMLYVTNAERAAEIMQTIAHKWPRLHFRLAQSVEHDQPANISWHGKSARELQSMARQWRSSLSAEGVRGVDWQDWQAYPALD